MRKSARKYVFEGMEMLPEVLGPFVKERLNNARPRDWQRRPVEKELNLRRAEGKVEWDQATLLRAMDIYWPEAFARVMGRAERSMVNELREVRNRLAHNGSFSFDDAERALDTMGRLMAAIDATATARRLQAMRDEIARTRLADSPQEQDRAEDSNRRPTIMRDAAARESLANARRERSRVENTLAPRPAARSSFRQAEFEAELLRMLAEARAAGRATCRVVSRELHRRVVGGAQPNRMPAACNAMWKLWRKQGSAEARIVHTTPSGRSSTIEIEYTA